MSWARAVGSTSAKNTLSSNNFPSLGVVISVREQKHTLNPKAPAWAPMTPPPSTEPLPLTEPLVECVQHTEKIIRPGIRLGGGEFGPSRVEGRDTISRKTVFKPNVVVQLMMERMGWIEGMGLGVELQGILVPIDTDMPKNIRFNVNVEGGRGGIGY